jgi:RHH-type proline utilization regulon transcriptional repressor/proline dehydrogenase/delta 1-pyrroline-5-carboxylate dehydrogenase
VLRQPFGGMGKSGFGPGMKAGGPNYVAQFMDFEGVQSSFEGLLPQTPTLAALCRGLQANPSPGDERIIAAATSYERSQREEFGVEHDHFRLVGQDNVRRYLPVGDVRIRIDAHDSPFDIFARACAAHIAGCRVVVSTPPGLDAAAVQRLEQLTEPWAGAIEFVEESDAQLAQAIAEGQVDRVRYAAPERASLEVLQAGNTANGCVVSVPVSAEGRLELLWYVREQSISTDYHRYGNLGLRADEARAEVL